MAGNKIVMKTNVVAHENDFDWEIQNVYEVSGFLKGNQFSVSPKCRTKFRSVMKLKDFYNSNYKCSIGFQRMDKCRGTRTVIAKLEFRNSDNNVLGKRASKFKCENGKKIHWCMSQTFMDSYYTHEKHGTESEDSLSTEHLNSSDNRQEHPATLKNNVLKVHGTLTIQGCCVASKVNTIPKEKRIKVNGGDLEEETVQDIINDFRIAQEDYLFSDMSLHVANHFIKAHKFVLNARCPYFRDLLYGGDPTCIIEIVDMDKDALAAFLKFLYTGVLEVRKTETCMNLYDIADKYEVPSLKKESAFLLKSRITDVNACELLKLADKHKDEDLKNYGISYIVDNFQSLNIQSGLAQLRNQNPELASTVYSFSHLFFKNK